ncbi:MAG: membrane protein of unknown function [Candidatus Thorarchaeota archaeon]|nr:MAG: membrane protein of unknown function [Candidatus Thorarchaeota archaeon]
MATEITTHDASSKESKFLRRFHVENYEMLTWTIVFGIIGALLVTFLMLIPFPYVMVTLFKFGLVLPLAFIALVGAIRGPIAGMLSGYLGMLLYDLVASGAFVGFTLPAASYGVLGFIVGLGVYDFENGRSLGKLSILATVGLLFTSLLILLLALTIQDYAVLAAIGFVFLPLLTTGLPSVIILTPVLARIWFMIMNRFLPQYMPT